MSVGRCSLSILYKSTALSPPMPVALEIGVERSEGVTFSGSELIRIAFVENPVWAEVITFLGGATILLAAVAWLIRSLAVHLLEKDLTTFKQNLINESNKELETLKAKLEIENARQQIKLSTLQVRRLEFLEELYKRLVTVSAEADSFAVEPVFGDDKELKGKADAFIDKYFEFYKFFGEHAIF